MVKGKNKMLKPQHQARSSTHPQGLTFQQTRARTVCTGPHPHPEAYYHWGLSHKLRSTINYSSITSLHNVRTQTYIPYSPGIQPEAKRRESRNCSKPTSNLAGKLNIYICCDAKSFFSTGRTMGFTRGYT